MHFKVPVGNNIDFQAMRAFIGRWFFANYFSFITILKLNSLELNHLENTVINALLKTKFSKLAMLSNKLTFDSFM